MPGAGSARPSSTLVNQLGRRAISQARVTPQNKSSIVLTELYSKLLRMLSAAILFVQTSRSMAVE